MSVRMVCVDDFERYAHKTLPKFALDYYRSGADEQITLKDNILAFRRFVEGCHHVRIAYVASVNLMIALILYYLQLNVLVIKFS